MYNLHKFSYNARSAEFTTSAFQYRLFASGPMGHGTKRAGDDFKCKWRIPHAYQLQNLTILTQLCAFFINLAADWALVTRDAEIAEAETQFGSWNNYL